MKRNSLFFAISTAAIIILFYAGCEPQEQTVTDNTAPIVIESPSKPEPKLKKVEPVASEQTAPTQQTPAERQTAEVVQKAKTESKQAEPKQVVQKVKTEPKQAEPIVQKTKTEPKQAEPEQAQVNPIAVTVNGIEITQADIDAKVKPQLDRMAAQMPPQYLDRYKSQIAQQVLETTIVEQLLMEQVKAENINVTEQDVIKHLETTGAKQQPPLSIDDIKALIEARGQNFDDTKKQIQKGLAFQQLMKTQFADQINFTEQDAKTYYDEHQKEFQTPEQSRASHILIKVDASDPNFDKAAAKAKADEILEKVKAGEDFATLAKSDSDGPSAKNGGDLGFFGKGQMVPAFEQAVLALEVGQVSDVVETRFGYHIIKKTDYKPAAVTEFDQAKDALLNKLTGQKRAKLAKSYVDSLKSQADIVYPPGKEPKPRPAPPTLNPQIK